MRRPIGLICVVLCILGLTTATAQASAGRSPGRVHDLHAVSHSSVSVSLSWTRPTSASFRTTVVRYAAGTHAPRTVRAGRSAARFGHLRHTLTVGRLRSGRSYSFSVFALDSAGHAGHRVSKTTVVAPAAITHVHSYVAASPTASRIRWTDPATHTLRRVVVRVAKGAAAPASPTRGRGVPVAPARGTAATLTGLARGTAYAVSVWALDRRGGYSSPGIVRFTTATGTEAGGTVTGLVTDTAGHPLSGVQVDTYGDTSRFSGPSPVTVTGTDGRYTVTAAAGEYELFFGGDGITGGTSDATGYVADSDDVVVRSGRTVTRPTLQLDPGAAVSGRLVDGAGRPVAGAQPYIAAVNAYVSPDSNGIFAFYLDEESTPRSSAADGSYVLRGLSTGGAFRVCAAPSSPGHSIGCTPHPLVLGAGQSATVPDVVLPAKEGGRVVGTVRGAGGTPLANAAVHLDGAGATQSNVYLYAPTDSAGRFSLAAVPPGTYRACAQTSTVSRLHRAGFAPGCSAHSVTVRSGAAVGVDVGLHVGAAVTGVVTGPSGRPVANAYVGAQSGEGIDITDAHGRYTLTGLAAARVQVCAEPSGAAEIGAPTGVLSGCWHGHAKAELSINRIRNGIDLRLARAGAVSGTVTGADGRPVPDAFVTAENTSDDEDDDAFGVDQTDAAGRYTIRGLPADHYDICADVLEASGSNSRACHRGAAAVRIGRTTSHVDARLPAASTIRVTVRDAAGLPVAGADAVALSSCPEDCAAEPLFGAKTGVSVAASQTTDSTGTVLLDGLKAGAYAVCLFAFDATTSAGGSPTGYADRCSGTTFSVRVTRGAGTSLTLVLSAGGAVSGRVADAAGRPVTGARALVSQSAATDYADDYFGDDPFDDDDDFFDDNGGESSPDSYGFSAADGTYTAIGVQPGSRTVCFVARAATGASRPGYLNQCRGAAPGKTTGGTKIVVAAGKVTAGADVTLTAAAGISGTVHQGGKPLGDAEVLVFSGRDDHNVVGSAGTSSTGRYTVTDLPAGTVTVCVIADKSDEQLVGRCWKNVAWNPEKNEPPLARATPITTVGASITTGIDLRLPR